MIKFGPSGNSIAFNQSGFSGSEQSAVWVKNLGLNCFEYSFGRGVNLSDEKATSIAKAFADAGVSLSVHAPYYINLANPEQENAQKSFGYLLSSAQKAKVMGAERVIFHPASQGKMRREQAVELTKKRLVEFTELVYQNNLEDIIFCPETMGKIGQIGTVEEITDFCLIDKIFVPAVDFGHINARDCGSLKTENDFYTRLEYMVDKLGYDRMKHFHIHFSKIEYSAKGEVRHLTFEDKRYGPEFEPLAKALKKLNLFPVVICESAGTQDQDAVTMQKIYSSV